MFSILSMMFLINSHSLVCGFVKSPHTFGYHEINLRERHTKIFLVQKDPNEMRVAEIKEELNTYSVSYSDCFDKESLVQRLISTREENPTTTAEKSVDEDDDKKEESADKERVEESVPDKTEVDKPTSDDFDRESTLQELRSLRVAELRTRLSSLEIRWGNMIEKEELVLALANAMEESSKFSGSGVLSPGKVGDLNSKEFNMEVSNGGKTKTPMLLDVYATWCGPCQMMAPHLQAAASELKSKVRIAKLDSDKCPDIASKLKVGGLPTIILFDADGKELKRMEGALMKDQILEFVSSEL